MLSQALNVCSLESLHGCSANSVSLCKVKSNHVQIYMHFVDAVPVRTCVKINGYNVVAVCWAQNASIKVGGKLMLCDFLLQIQHS